MNKNNILLLTIIFLVVVSVFYGNYVFKVNNESFQTYDPATTPDEPDDIYGCKFIPWGPTIKSCTKNCLTNQRVGLWDIDGRQCSDAICKQKCALCTNESSCQWISTWSKEEKDKMLKITEEDTALSKLVPRQLYISGIGYPGTEVSTTEIKISWENYGDSNAFMIHYYNMKRSDNMIRVDNFDNINDTSTTTIQNLDANSKYSIILYGINEYGISKSSNIIVVDT
jgi:hypothetical protein